MSIPFKADSGLTESQEKVCRCYLKVAAKQPADCDPGVSHSRGEHCYNAYAVCNKSVGTSYRGCSKAYDFEAMDDLYLEAYIRLHHVSYSGPYERQKAIAAIEAKLG